MPHNRTAPVNTTLDLTTPVQNHPKQDENKHIHFENPTNEEDSTSDEEDEEEEGFHFKWKIRDTIILIAWILVAPILIWYFVSNISDYIASRITPSLSVSYYQQAVLRYPAVTICNFNPIEDGNNGLNITSCVINSPTGYSDCEFSIDKAIIMDGDGLTYECIVLNNDTSSSPNATITGYEGLISTEVILPSDAMVVGSNVGVTVTFHEPGTIASLEGDETLFGTAGNDNYYTIRKHIMKKLVPTPSSRVVYIPNYSVLNRVIAGEEDLTVPISFCYNSLNIKEVKETFTKDPLQLLGELAGVLGTLYGIELLKILRCILMIPKCVRKLSFKPIWSELN